MVECATDKPAPGSGPAAAGTAGGADTGSTDAGGGADVAAGSGAGADTGGGATTASVIGTCIPSPTTWPDAGGVSLPCRP